jgi:hypothetical protein
VTARSDERRQQRVRECFAQHSDSNLPIETLAWIILGSLTAGAEDAETGAWARALRVVVEERYAALVAAATGEAVTE